MRKPAGLVAPATDLHDLEADMNWLIVRLPPKGHPLMRELAEQGIRESDISDLTNQLFRLGLAARRAAQKKAKKSA